MEYATDYNIDYNATVDKFFRMAIEWLDKRPAHLSDGVNKEQISRDYLLQIKSDPVKYTANDAVFTNSDKLDGFIEHKINKSTNKLVVNNDLYFAVMYALDAIGEYRAANNNYTKKRLIESIKEFNIALNRKKLLKVAFYKMKTPYYFAQQRQK